MVADLTGIWKDAKRIVVKIGSALLVDADTGHLRSAWLKALAADIEALRQRGVQVIVVSSGSIALGGRMLGLNKARERLETAQAAAAVGQIRLAHGYEEVFAPHGVTVAQMLLTLGDLEDRRRYLNARATLETLLSLHSLPVINENDTVATAEIKFGDNDRLAARVAQIAGADLLVLFSDIDGLYTADPNKDPAATLIPEVAAITHDIEAMGGPSALPAVGSGGMVTKIMAAKIATSAGCHMLIVSGKPEHALQRAEAESRGTLFRATTTGRQARKSWLHGLMAAAGTLTVDNGAVTALKAGKSLLPAGVTAVSGHFERGDMVQVRDAAGTAVAQGLIAYSSADAARIKGRKLAEVRDILGYEGRDELIHRDDLVLL